MEIPNELYMAIEKLTKNKTTQLTKSAKEISRRYRTQQGTDKRLLSTESEAAAYAATRMPATYASVKRALEHVLNLFKYPLETLLDVGAGTGAATWAAESILDLQSIICIEREDTMRQVGMEIAQEGPKAIQNAKWIKQDIAKEKIIQKADIVISSYVLNEMTDETREKVIIKLWESSDKILLIVEPGAPKNFAQMLNVRQILLENGAHIIAPCPHENQCQIPYPENWCHFASRISRSRTHRRLKEGEAPYEDEKFTYLAVTKSKSFQTQSRIIRHPIISSGFVTLELCTSNGIKKVSVSKKDGDLYKMARKAKTGDMISL